MTVDRALLAARFAELEDAVLIGRLRQDAYADVAREVALAELESRGHDLRALGLVGSEAEEYFDEDASDSLTAIARFSVPVDAQVLAGCLEASGIPVFMGNVETAHALNYMGAAVPVVVRVPTRLAAEARAVMAAFEAGEFALDEDVDPGVDGERP